MNKARKGTLLTIIIILALLGLFHVLTFNNLEITDEKLFSVYRSISFIVFCSLLAALGIILPKDYDGLFGRIGSMVLIFLTGILWIFLTTFSPFNKAKMDKQILFINKENPKLLIIEQVTYAGAIGSDHYDTILVRQLMKNFRWTKSINKSEIDAKDWSPAESNFNDNNNLP